MTTELKDARVPVGWPWVFEAAGSLKSPITQRFGEYPDKDRLACYLRDPEGRYDTHGGFHAAVFIKELGEDEHGMEYGVYVGSNSKAKAHDHNLDAAITKAQTLLVEKAGDLLADAHSHLRQVARLRRQIGLKTAPACDLSDTAMDMLNNRLDLHMHREDVRKVLLDTFGSAC